MSIGPDRSYAGAIYAKQSPAGSTINGNAVANEQVIDAGGLLNICGLEALSSAILPAKVSFTIAPNGVASKGDVTAQLVDGGGQPVAIATNLDLLLSDSATGAGLTATTPSGGLAVDAGTQLTAYVAGKALRLQTDATGHAKITITDTAKTGFYVAVSADCLRLPAVSRQLTAADYS